MASKKKNQVDRPALSENQHKVSGYRFEFERNTLDAPIQHDPNQIDCDCDETTTRNECETKYGSWGNLDLVEYTCPHCGKWIRTDTTMKPLPPKQKDKESV